LKNVSNSNKGKNEITLQFHQPEDAKVSLMEIRFYVPPGDVDGDAVEVRINVRVSSNDDTKYCHRQDFHQNVMRGAAVLTAKAGDAICSLSDINCLVPR
jgi:structure-specific recognition protein 1